MEHRESGKPFYFWFGANEPHRSYEEGSWRRNNKQPDEVDIPGLLPDSMVVKGDILDYAVEIEWAIVI